MARAQFNMKIEQEVQNDFRRACSFDLGGGGRPRKHGEVLEELMAAYAAGVFRRKEVGRELSRLKKS